MLFIMYEKKENKHAKLNHHVRKRKKNYNIFNYANNIRKLRLAFHLTSSMFIKNIKKSLSKLLGKKNFHKHPLSNNELDTQNVIKSNGLPWSKIKRRSTVAVNLHLIAYRDPPRKYP